jgi:ABC-2 type transport system permease protein
MFSAMIKKELLLVLRDKHALMALFVLPAVFILIMSVAMRDQFSSKNIEFTLFVKDSDKTQMSQEIIKLIANDNRLVQIKEKSAAQFFLVIPKRYEKNSKKLLKINVQKSLKENEIEVFKSLLSEHVLKARLHYMSQNVEEYSSKASRTLANLEISTDKLYKVKYKNSKKLPNATQQSVPAWIVFGMFFIIIPMSTIYINERKQNTLMRLNSMNVSVFAMTFTKSIPYFIINQVQVWIMIGVGVFLVPLFDTPALAINGSVFAILEIATGLSLAAIGISTLIAVSASSSEQATTIGGILNLLLGAVGGVMVPKFIMPESMQTIAEYSPMAWGLDGFLDIFLSGANTQDVFIDFMKLFVFGLVCLGISMIILQIRIKKGL